MIKYLRYLGVAATVLGMALLAGSFAWQQLPSSTFYDDQQGEAYVNAAARYHNDTFAEGGDSSSKTGSRADYKQQRAKLDRALAAKERTPRLLLIAGVVTTGLGIILLMAQTRPS